MNIDYLIIVNLMAGGGMAGKKHCEVKSFLDSHKLTYQSIEIYEPKRISLVKWDKNIVINRAIVCIGGDGTVSETVGFIINNELKLPLAIIPTGTANIFYNTLNLWTGNYDFLVKDNYKPVSIGIAEYNDAIEYFTIGLGIGFSQKYIELTDKSIKKNLGSISYFLTAIKGLFDIKPIPVTITTKKDSKTRRMVLLLAFNIFPVVLKIFPLFPFKKVNHDDNKLSIYYLRYRTKILAVIGTLACHIFGRYNFHLINKIKSDEIVLSSKVYCSTQIDGELRGQLPVRLSVYQEKLKLLV